MTTPLIPGRLRWTHCVLLVGGYVLLDWASYIHAMHGLNITPWSPGPALGLAFVMRFGAKVAPLLLLAIVLADSVVRDLPTTFPLTLLIATLLASGYTALGEIMRRRFDHGLMLMHHRALLAWIVLVIAGTLCVSAGFVSVLVVTGVLGSWQWLEAFTRYWIGDAVGVLITMPLFAMLMDERGRAFLGSVLHRWETWLYGVVMLGTIGVTLGLGPETDVRYFYIVFLPMVWAALRGGLAGAVLTATLAQLAIIAAVQLRGFTTVTVFDVQALAVVLVLVGFLVGVFIDEQRRLGAELRQSLRLAAAGEMAAALAHELNQPLTAMSAYGAACEDLISQGEQGDRLLDMVRRIVAESHRTADVVTRLRDFFRTGDTRLERVPVAELLHSAAEPFAARAARGVVELSVGPVVEACVLVDRLQIEVVMRNLVVNAFEAVEAESGPERWIRIGAEAAGPGRICLTVEDSGPGPGGSDAARLFEPFHSSKSSGLGLGLAISRSIAEAHGGRLWTEAGANGIFKLLLPLEGSVS
ncbi:MAG: MASE1 domain-containing protein [Burkholderiales bacterium]|nr:MASE1 domain-containing protein [Burkholderiales bacterium]